MPPAPVVRDLARVRQFLGGSTGLSEPAGTGVDWE
jgi:hypothetical protein